MSSAVPATPRSRTTYSATTTPVTSRAQTSHIIQSSPHYATTRRHSLYGVEDRVVIDPGSRIWKVGFSGEGRPRDVFLAGAPDATSLWKLQRAADPVERAEEDKLLEVRVQARLRSVFHDSLLTDPKARKVIVVEHPLLPLYIKDIIAKVLFENHVPSVSFASSHLLSLLSVGRITGLVLDCGHLESVALPIFAARPMYPQLQTTPLAGARLTSHIRALLLMFGTYLPPPTSLSSAVSVPSANRATRVPQEVLMDSVVEEIKTRCCFVGEALESTVEGREDSVPRDDGSELDLPPPSDATQSESEFSSQAGGVESVQSVSSHRDSSEFSVVSSSRPYVPSEGVHGEKHLQALTTLYTRHSTATDLRLPVVPPPAQQTGTGRGTLIIPGWIRERAAEVLFEGGDVDESSVAEVILDALMKVPLDLRKTMASSILIAGGTAMLPGFIPRLHAELQRAVAGPRDSPPRLPSRSGRSPPPAYHRYAVLHPLAPYFSILNNPNPPSPLSDRAAANAGKAPAFSPALLAWIGGSLAGAMKTGGAEVSREKWDEANTVHDVEENMDLTADFEERTASNVLPDWTRSPLPSGAPHFPRPSQTQVGA